MNSPLAAGPALYRIGAVSKLSGVPVPTLRIWQTRYNAFSPTTTSGQHRLYDEQDLRKAVLLKSLTGQGHGIRLIAGLPVEQLQALAEKGRQLSRSPGMNPSAPARPAAWAVVGQPLAQRLQSDTFPSARVGIAWPLQQVWPDLNSALQQALTHNLEGLVVSVNTVNPSVAEQILALQPAARQTVVLYGFGQKEALARLTRAGVVVHRETLDDAALAEILRRSRPPMASPTWALRAPNEPLPPRQFSDAVLQRVANITSDVLCECPRHVAELIAQLGRFEDYSLDCLEQSPKDKELHIQLNLMAASARALFEQALQMVADHEGISLHDSP